MKPTLLKIIEQLDTMRLIIERAGVTDKLTVYKQAGDLPDKILEEAWDWLSDVKEKEYAACMKIRRLCSEATWKRYETWGDAKEYREMKLFNDAIKVFTLRTSAAVRPAFFKPRACKTIIEKANRHAQKSN